MVTRLILDRTLRRIERTLAQEVGSRVQRASGNSRKQHAMMAPTKFARFDARVRAFLAEHFKNRPPSLVELTALWETYARLGLPNGDFVAEFTNGKPASLAQRTWELLLAQHLHDQGHKLTQLAQFGGGFRDFAQVDASRIK